MVNIHLDWGIRISDTLLASVRSFRFNFVNIHLDLGIRNSDALIEPLVSAIFGSIWLIFIWTEVSEFLILLTIYFLLIKIENLVHYAESWSLFSVFLYFCKRKLQGRQIYPEILFCVEAFLRENAFYCFKSFCENCIFLTNHRIRLNLWPM